MSFPKAPLKRFNEQIGCAPPPGAYDVKISDGLKGPVSFEKSQRFRAKKDSNSDGLFMDKEVEFTSPTRLRKHSSHGSTPNLRQKPEKDLEFLREIKKQKMLEKEIRSLLKERAEQDKKLLALEEEFKKTEVKLVTAVREKSSLSANIASLERQIADLKKANELLKTKFSDDSAKKRLNSLSAELMDTKNKVDAKDKELSCLQVTFEKQITLLKKDLECSTATLEALMENKVFLEENHHVANMQRESLQKELDQAQSSIKALRRDHTIVQEQMSVSQEQLKNVSAEMRQKLKECDIALQTVTNRLSDQCLLQEKTENQLFDSEKRLEQTLQKVTLLEEQLMAANNEKSNLMVEKDETEKKLANILEEMRDIKAQAEKYKLDADLIENLLMQKKQEQIVQKDLLTQREQDFSIQIKELEEKYRKQMENKENVLTESHAREESLKIELELIKQKLSQREDSLYVLQKQEVELRSKLQIEEDTSCTLRSQMQNVQEEMMRERRLLEDELEGMLDELDSLQIAEQEADKIILQLENENKRQAEELVNLEATLKEKTAELERVKEKHRIAVLELKEAHSNTLLKLYEFESFNTSAKTEIESLKSANMSFLESLAIAQKSNEEHQEQLQQQIKLKEDLEQQILQVKEVAVKTKEKLEQQLLEKQEASAKIKECFEQQLREQQELEARTKEQLEQQLLQLKESAAKAIEGLKQQILEQETAAKTIEHLEQQLCEQEEAAAKTKESLEQKLCEQEEDTLKSRESWEEQLHVQVEAMAKMKESLEQQLLEQAETAAKAKESLEQQLREEAEAAAKTKESLEQHIHELKVVAGTYAEQQHELVDLKSQCAKLQDYSIKMKNEYTSMLESAQLNLEKKEAEMKALEERLFTRESELKVEVAQMQSLLQTQEEIVKLRDNSARNYETEEENKWRVLYEELRNKVRPFQEQLDAFEAEKNALLNEHGAAQEEINKLSDAYAKLLGHQNQKQKIKHVMKLKTENCQLRQEVSKLRSQLAKEKQAEKQLQEQLNDIQNVKQFDPSKAFQHDVKENIVPKVPLREGNRKKI
ncbi:hyaluronan mediated motility receptor isoform X1 [Pelobates fuscus]|uniref:hyaluronan mediated motility receptor isoform X1 n=1 Tax=Pelobates fuscus TaxID=191477 RepID=UPI002FE43D46